MGEGGKGEQKRQSELVSRIRGLEKMNMWTICGCAPRPASRRGRGHSQLRIVGSYVLDLPLLAPLTALLRRRVDCVEMNGMKGDCIEGSFVTVMSPRRREGRGGLHSSA